MNTEHNFEILKQTLIGGEAIVGALESVAHNPNCPKQVIKELTNSIEEIYILAGEAAEKSFNSSLEDYKRFL